MRLCLLRKEAYFKIFFGLKSNQLLLLTVSFGIKRASLRQGRLEHPLKVRLNLINGEFLYEFHATPPSFQAAFGKNRLNDALGWLLVSSRF